MTIYNDIKRHTHVLPNEKLNGSISHVRKMLAHDKALTSEEGNFQIAIEKHERAYSDLIANGHLQGRQF